MSSSKPPVIKFSVLQAFFANLFVATSHPTPFAWNEEHVKRATLRLMQKHPSLRPYGAAFLSKKNVIDAPDGQQPPYRDVMRWFHHECLDIVDGRRDLVKLNDACLHFANNHRSLLDNDALETMRTVGKDFFQATQLEA